MSLTKDKFNVIYLLILFHFYLFEVYVLYELVQGQTYFVHSWLSGAFVIFTGIIRY